jgi:hypothetical protein
MKLPRLHRKRIEATLRLEGAPADRIAATMVKIESTWQTFHKNREAESAARYRDGAGVSGQILNIPVNRYKSKGAPPKATLRAYIAELVAIYKHATGKKLGRSVPSEAGSSAENKQSPKYIKRKEIPRPFLLACTRAANIAIYPRGIIRSVLKNSR